MAAWRGRKPCQGRPEGRRAGMHLDSIGPAFRGARREKPLASKSLKLQCLSKSGTWESLLRPRQNLPAIPGQEVKAFQQVPRTTPTSAGQGRTHASRPLSVVTLQLCSDFPAQQHPFRGVILPSRCRRQRRIRSLGSAPSIPQAEGLHMIARTHSHRDTR